MPASHLVASGNLAALGNRNTHHLVHAGVEVGVVFTVEDLHVHHDAALAMGHTQGGVLHIAGLFTKNGAQQAFFRGQFLLTLGRNLANQDGFRPDFGADANDAVLIKVTDSILAGVGDFTGDFLGAQLGIARFDFVFFNVDAGIAVVLNQAL